MNTSGVIDLTSRNIEAPSRSSASRASAELSFVDPSAVMARFQDVFYNPEVCSVRQFEAGRDFDAFKEHLFFLGNLLSQHAALQRDIATPHSALSFFEVLQKALRQILDSDKELHRGLMYGKGKIWLSEIILLLEKSNISEEIKLFTLDNLKKSIEIEPENLMFALLDTKTHLQLKQSGLNGKIALQLFHHRPLESFARFIEKTGRLPANRLESTEKNNRLKFEYLLLNIDAYLNPPLSTFDVNPLLLDSNDELIEPLKGLTSQDFSKTLELVAKDAVSALKNTVQAYQNKVISKNEAVALLKNSLIEQCSSYLYSGQSPDAYLEQFLTSTLSEHSLETLVMLSLFKEARNQGWNIPPIDATLISADISRDRRNKSSTQIKIFCWEMRYWVEHRFIPNQHLLDPNVANQTSYHPLTPAQQERAVSLRALKQADAFLANVFKPLQGGHS